MRAVNLIPRDLRRGGPGTETRSGAGVYAVLGVLSALVVLVGAYVLAGNTVSDKKSELARIETEKQAVAAEAAALKPYTDFATLSAARTQTVSQLAASRFDWDNAFRQLARVLPSGVELASLVGTVNSAVAVPDAPGGGTSSLRKASNDPALELSGCTTSQPQVARVMSRLRLMDGVRRVSLVSAAKSDEAPSNPDTKDVVGCPRDRSKFDVVVFYSPLGGPSTTPGSTARSQPVPAPPTSGDLPATGPSGTQAVSQETHAK